MYSAVTYTHFMCLCMFSSGLIDCKERRIYVWLFFGVIFPRTSPVPLEGTEREKLCIWNSFASIVWSLILSSIQMHERGEPEVELPLLGGFGSFFQGRKPPSLWLPKCGQKHCWKGVSGSFLKTKPIKSGIRLPHPWWRLNTRTANCRFIHIFLVGIS